MGDHINRELGRGSELDAVYNRDDSDSLGLLHCVQVRFPPAYVVEY